MKQDPLALAFFGAALVLLAGLLFYVIAFKAPEKPEPVPAPGTPGLVENLRSFVAGMSEKAREKLAAAPPARPAAVPPVASVPAPAPAPSAKSAAKAAPAPAGAPILEAGRMWRYAVVVEPPTWRDATLTYRTQRENAGIGVLTDFAYAGGKMNFHLGSYTAGHPSHANTRFPGFFMHPSYFKLPLEPGQKLSWGWAWQPVREGRMKWYDGRVLRWEDVTVPAGTFRAAVIEADLYYIEGGQTRAQARETLWYAPQVAQLVKVVRDGRTPDEGSSRIVAELAEYR